MSNLQPNCYLKVDFQNVGKHTGGKWLNHDTKRHNGKSIPEIKTWNSPAEYPSCVARCYIKGPDGAMLNSIFWKKVQGQNILRDERLNIHWETKSEMKVQIKSFEKVILEFLGPSTVLGLLAIQHMGGLLQLASRCISIIKISSITTILSL